MKQKNKIIYVILITLIIICIIMIINLVNKNKTALTPDYAPGTIDTNAIKEKDSDEKLNVPSGGGAVSLEYSNIVSIDKKNKIIKLYFKNPSKSRESMLIELVILQKEKEYVIAKSDLLPPGYALYNLNLNTSLDIPAGGYQGKIKTTYYNEETGVKQIVNTEIEVKIEVK